MTPAARERIDKALRLIQEAQTQMDRALSELSTLRYAGPTHRRGYKVYDQIHAYWYKVQALRDSPKISTDSEPEPSPLHVVKGSP